MPQAFTVAGTVVALVIGLATIIGWIASQSLAGTIAVAFPAGGAAYLIGLNWYWVYNGIIKERHGAYVFSAVFVSGLAVFLVVTSGLDWGLGVFGGLGLLWAVVIGPVEVWHLYQRFKRSRKTCPDCLESVKAGARVCRWCGHRFDGVAP